MPAQIRVVDQKFFAQNNNGEDFSLNPSDFSMHLKGGVLEKMKAVFVVELDWRAILSDYNTLYDSSSQTLRIESDGVDFIADNFSVGDSVKLSQNQVRFEGTVTSVSANEMVLGNVTVPIGNPLDKYTVGVNGPDVLTGLTTQESLKYQFGLIENDENFNTLSKLTNTDQAYLINGLGAVDDYKQGISFGNNKAWVTGSCEAAFKGLVLDKDYYFNQNTTQQFEIVHEFIINPFYRDGEEDSLSGEDVPPRDIFNGDLSLKYVFQTEFRTTINNPNTSKVSQYDTELGSVGYFGETYNGFPNDFTIPSFQITDTLLNPVDQLDVKSLNKVSLQVAYPQNIFIPGQRVVVGHSSIVESDVYNNSTKEYDQIWTNESVVGVQGSIVNGTLIKNVDIQLTDLDLLDISFDVDFTSSQEDVLSDGQDYILYIVVHNQSLTVDDGYKSTIIIDLNQYFKNSDIDGLWEGIWEQTPYPYQSPNPRFNSGKAFIEDGQYAFGSFRLLDEFEGKDVNLDALRFKLVGFNNNNNTWFDIRTFDFDLSSQVQVGNIQEIEVDQTRGYILKDSDDFNAVEITTTNNDGTYTYYEIKLGYKLPWQDWLELSTADTIFYDKNKSLNGLNNNISNYSNSNGYFIRMLLEADVTTNGITTTYIDSSGNFEVFNRETDDQDPDAYTCEINTYDKNGNALENNIINKDFTELRAMFTPTVPPIFSQSVDFTEVSTEWNRFAHGNKCNVPSDVNIRLNGDPQIDVEGTWANDQSGYVEGVTDTMAGLNFNIFNKDQLDLYTSTPTSIQTTSNIGALYGCYSIESYEFYDISGEMFSQSLDNDALAFNIAFNIDENGVERTLSLVATTGGVLLDLNPNYVQGDINTNTFQFNPPAPDNVVHWALVYNFGKSDCKQLDVFRTSNPATGWGNLNQTTQTFIFSVKRSANLIEVTGDWDLPSGSFSNTFNYDLNSDTDTIIFNNFQKIGFSFQSQDQGGFKNVNLTNPAGDFYGVLRMEVENSPNDFGISELSTLREAPINSILKQSTSDERKATLSWNGNSFVLQGEVDTNKIDLGQRYKFSALLRQKNLY